MWQTYIGGLLSAPRAEIEALAAEPVPTTAAEYRAAAARHGIDGGLLRRTVALAIRHLPSCGPAAVPTGGVMLIAATTGPVIRPRRDQPQPWATTPAGSGATPTKSPSRSRSTRSAIFRRSAGVAQNHHTRR